jgi:hypothetical protein
LDRLTALVAIAHLKLRLEVIQRHPDILEDLSMIDIKRPIELAGMAGRLKRAERAEQDIAVTGKRYDTVLDAIDERHAALKSHVGSLESTASQLDQVINRMVAGTNGGPNDGEDSSRGSTSSTGSTTDGSAEPGQVISSTTTSEPQ